MFLGVGLSSTVWFLIRVIPKPSRAAYPCMQASAPVMSAFVLVWWSYGMDKSQDFYQKPKIRLCLPVNSSRSAVYCCFFCGELGTNLFAGDCRN